MDVDQQKIKINVKNTKTEFADVILKPKSRQLVFFRGVYNWAAYNFIPPAFDFLPFDASRR